MLWLIFAITIGGLSDADVILANNTGLYIARLEIDGIKIEEIEHTNKVLVSIKPTTHHLKIVFRGGADVDWPKLDFKGVHEIFVERIGNKFGVRIEKHE